jgi:uncharacterized protein (DUF433 family)
MALARAVAAFEAASLTVLTAQLYLPNGRTYHRSAMPTPDRIVIDPAIAHGKPVIRGTRIPVTTIVGSLAGGMSFEDVQREYDVTAEDIRAALKFVGDLAQQESFHPLPSE